MDLPGTILTMLFSGPALLGALALIPSLIAAAPAGSKHTVYLANCVPEECPIGLCNPDDFNLLAAAYFRNGPPSSSVTSPTTLGTLSGSISSWEGTRRSVRLGSEGTFATNIAAGAKSAAKSDIVGEATLTSASIIGIGGTAEPFVCFRDGTTKFTARYETDRYTCTADYYCPSIDTGSSKPTK